MTRTDPLWTPDEDFIKTTAIADFAGRIGLPGNDYHSLWKWSVDHSADFWSRLWDFCNVTGDKGDRLLLDPGKMPGARFFPDASLNYAENCLKRRDDADAVVFWGEDKVKTRLSWKQLYDAVSRFRQFLLSQGVTEGDRVAGFVSNMPQALIAMLATSSIGAVWSSASPDFGVQGVLDRFGQIEPKILVAVNGYFYNGKVVDCMPKIRDFLPQLPGVEKTVIIPYANPHSDMAGLDNAVLWDDALAPFTAGPIPFRCLPFSHPLFIMFSSGTTGIPKCIVHGQGGTLLQHLKEHRLQCDIRENDRVFYFTTCGWMMWNWQMTALASGATLLLYDGSPFYPGGHILFDYADAEKMTLFGTAAKYIDALNKGGIEPKKTHDLKTVRTMTSTGSPLVHESFDFIYNTIKSDLHLASISGGTDIVSCFVLGNPVSPVYRGEIQGAGLAMAMDAFNDDGQPVAAGEKGELVCTKPFPSMPVSFWNDPGGSRYRAAYFDRFDDIWCHGDWVEKTDHGGWIIHGRSDATLNPGGVRIGTAEIYRQVEQIPEIRESIAVGQDWDGDVRVVLFVVLQQGMTLSEELKQAIRLKIRTGASPRHVPAKIIAVADIPRTKSGKITELAVREIIHARPVKNIEALANPESLDFYKNIRELAA